MTFTTGDHIYLRYRKTTPTALYSATVCELPSFCDYFSLQVHFTIGTENKKPKLFTVNRRGAHVPWTIKIHKSSLPKQVLTEDQFHKAIETDFGTTLDQLKANVRSVIRRPPVKSKAQNFSESLPVVSADMAIAEIIAQIESSTVKYVTGHRVSCWATTRALHSRTEDLSLKSKLNLASLYFVGDISRVDVMGLDVLLAKEVAA